MQDNRAKESKGKRLTYYLKEENICPLCQRSFQKEELHKSGGRIISGDLTDELHRVFLPSQKFGPVYPLIYSIVVCPKCLYASFNRDFLTPLKDTSLLSALQAQHQKKIAPVSRLISQFNFLKPRTLKEGIASYLLALFTYEFFPPQSSPTFKQGLCCLRASWLCQDFHTSTADEHYDYLRLFLLQKARYLYTKTLEYEQESIEVLPPELFMGPDLDKNYGFDGVVYLAALLEYRYGGKQNLAIRLKRIKQVRFATAKIFGIGKASKARPSTIIDKVKDLHELLGKEISELELAIGNE